MRRRSVEIGFLAVSAALFAAHARAESPAPAPGPPSAGEAPPEWDEPDPSARLNLALTGAAVTGVWYGLALGGSFAFPSAKASDELRIPIVGPWLGIGDTGCRDGDADCSTVLVVFGAILMGIDGVGQAAGLGFAIESLFLPTASAGKSERERHERAAPSRVRVVPVSNGKDSLGLGIAGVF